MKFLERVENPFAKGILVSLPAAFLGLVLQLVLGGGRGGASNVLNVISLACSPAILFCTPTQKLLTAAWLLLLGLACSLYFVKEMRSRLVFSLGFSLFFWLFQLPMSVVFFIGALVVAGGF